MNIQLVIIAIVSAIATIPIVLLIPHRRQSPMFDRVLGVSTWLLGVLGAFMVNNSLGSNSAFAQPELFQLPIVSTVVGIIAGALSIHVLIWGMDRFAPSEDEIAENENEEQ